VATKIKLMRLGKMRAPYYRIVVADARTKRDGRSIETIGKYHPKEDPSFIEVDSERAQYWLGVGAQPTEAVAAILRVTGDWQKFKGEPAPAPMKVAAPKPDKKALYEAAVRAGMDEPTTEATTAKKKAAPKKATASADAPAADAEASEAMPPQVDLAEETADRKPAADAAPAEAETAADAEASAAMPPQIDVEEPAPVEKPAE
jgi:small subunit ribosomal protein S16